MPEINSQEDAVRYIGNLFEKRGYEVKTYWRNNDRHTIMVAKRGNERTDSYIMFKHEFFFTFSRFFSEDGFGESINQEHLKFILDAGTLSQILIVYPEGIVYSVKPEVFGRYGHARTQYMGEKTVSISIKLLEDRWDRGWQQYELNKFLDSPKVPETLKERIRKWISGLGKWLVGA